MELGDNEQLPEEAIYHKSCILLAAAREMRWVVSSTPSPLRQVCLKSSFLPQNNAMLLPLTLPCRNERHHDISTIVYTTHQLLGLETFSFL